MTQNATTSIRGAGARRGRWMSIAAAAVATVLVSCTSRATTVTGSSTTGSSTIDSSTTDSITTTTTGTGLPLGTRAPASTPTTVGMTSIPSTGASHRPAPASIELPVAESIEISTAPGTWSVPQYSACGESFYVGALPIYVDPNMSALGNHQYARMAASLTGEPYGFAIVLGDDCDHGGSVQVSPSASAVVKALVSAPDGGVLIATVTPDAARRSVVTLTGTGSGRRFTATVIWRR